MRYHRYCEKLATNSSQIQPQNLPPTSAAARHHSLRVYLQVKQWKGENEGMSLEDYGWKVTEGQVLPRMTDLPAAPESLLQMIRCNSSSDCASARCMYMYYTHITRSVHAVSTHLTRKCPKMRVITHKYIKSSIIYYTSDCNALFGFTEFADNLMR